MKQLWLPLIITLTACGDYFTKPICDCIRPDGTCCNTAPVPNVGASASARRP
jgi:hypothetical protein